MSFTPDRAARRRVFVSVAVCVGALALGGVAQADDVASVPPLDAGVLLQEVTQPAVDLSAATALLTRLALPGEVIEDPLVVTDSELLSVGAAPFVQERTLLRASSSSVDALVDDDRVQCPNAGFTTITAAVLATPPGGHVRVCPGRYRETVNVAAPGLLLTGTASRETTCPSDAADDATRYSIVEPPAGSGFDLQADGITVEDFVVQGADSASNGIVTSDAHSGYVIRRNIVQNNALIGVDLRGNGAAESEVSKNCVRNQANQDGFRADNLTNAELRDNRFEANRQAIDLLDCNCSQLDIEHNDLVGNQFGIAAGHSPFGPSSSATQVTATTVEQNHFTGNVFAMSVNIGASGLHVDYNKSEGDSFGMLFAGATNNVIEKNHVTSSGSTGIQLGFPPTAAFPTTGNTVTGNKLELNGFSGLRLSNNAVSNTVRDNHSAKNGFFGIRVDGARDGVAPQAAGNTIERNKFADNGSVDCSDQTDGTGTSGTANFWIEDQGRTEDRPGICVNKT